MTEFRGKNITLDSILSRPSINRWKRISLERTRLTDDDVLAIIQIAQNVEEIQIVSNFISDRSLAAISALPKLVSLLIQDGPLKSRQIDRPPDARKLNKHDHYI